MELKRCPRCGLTKQLDEFSPDRSRRDGRTSKCRPCDAVLSRSYYRRNPERAAAYYRTNRTGIVEARRLRLADPEIRRQRTDAQRARRAEARDLAVVIYGGRCVWCGATEELEFDHVRGDGVNHRRHESPQKMIRRIVREGRPLPDVLLQLLCRPHHQEKTMLQRRAARELGRV